MINQPLYLVLSSGQIGDKDYSNQIMNYQAMNIYSIGLDSFLWISTSLIE